MLTLPLDGSHSTLKTSGGRKVTTRKVLTLTDHFETMGSLRCDGVPRLGFMNECIKVDVNTSGGLCADDPVTWGLACRSHPCLV